MTDQVTGPATENAQPLQVKPDVGSRLEALHAAYADAKAAADGAASTLKAVTDAIKLELTQAAPEGELRINLVGPSGPALRMAYTESWRLDSTKLKAEDPETYVRYAKKSGAWVLKALSSGGAGGREG